MVTPQSLQLIIIILWPLINSAAVLLPNTFQYQIQVKCLKKQLWEKHDVMKCVKYLLNLFGGRNVNCLRQTTFHEPVGVKYQKKDYINKINN